MTLLLPVLLLACAPPAGPQLSGGTVHAPEAYAQGWYQDWFSPTYEICGRPDEYRPYEPMWDDWAYGDVEFSWDFRQLSEPCIDAMLADIKLDREEIEQTIGEYHWITEWRFALWIYFMLASPVGTVDELLDRVEGDAAYQWRPFALEISALSHYTGEDQVRPLVYNLAMSSILKTDWDREVEPGSAWINIEAREVHLNDQHQQSAFMAPLFLHEATHAWLYRGHVTCLNGSTGEGRTSCDDDWSGAYGFAGSYARLLLETLPWDEDPRLANLLDVELEAYLFRVHNMVHTECCASAQAAQEGE